MIAGEAVHLVRERHEQEEGPRDSAICMTLDALQNALVREVSCGECTGTGKVPLELG